jgi:hypothetical protein
MKLIASLLMPLLINPASYSQSVTASKAATPARTGQARSTRVAMKFEVVEATIADIQGAILSRRITSTDLVRMYLTRIKAYNGVCVDQPHGILGTVTPIPHAGQLNALITLNLRPEERKRWGFDDRKARSMTDHADDAPKRPDALEVASASAETPISGTFPT